MTEQGVQSAFRIWNLIAGLVIGLAAVLFLTFIYDDVGGDSGFVNWLTIFIGGFFSVLIVLGQRRLMPVVGDDIASLVDAGSDRVVGFAHRRPVPAVNIGIVMLFGCKDPDHMTWLIPAIRMRKLNASIQYLLNYLMDRRNFTS